MGHLTNPLGFRVGRSQYWKSLWASSPQLYAAFNNNFLFINNYFKIFFGHVLPVQLHYKGLVYSHAWIRLNLNRLVITLFLYSANLVKMQKPKYIKFLAYLKHRVDERKQVKRLQKRERKGIVLKKAKNGKKL